MGPHEQTGETAALSELLRPRSIGDILDTTIRLYRRHFLLYFGIVVVMQLIVFIVSQGFQIPLHLMKRGAAPSGQGQEAAVAFLREIAPLAIPAAFGFILLIGVSIVAYQFSTGGLVAAVAATFLGRPMTVAEAYQAVLARFWSLLGAGILSSLIGFAAIVAGVIAFLLCLAVGQLLDGGAATVIGVLSGAGLLGVAVVAALYLFLSFLLAPQAVMLEEASALDALRRSWELMWRRTDRGMFRNNVWRVSIILSVVFFLNAIIAILVQTPIFILAAVLAATSSDAGALAGGLPLWLQVPGQLLQTVAGSLVMPVGMVAIILFYYDIRIRFEGYDLQVLTGVLDRR